MNFSKIIVFLLASMACALYGGKKLIMDQKSKQKDEVTRLVNDVDSLHKKFSTESSLRLCEDVSKVSEKVWSTLRLREEQIEGLYYDTNDVGRVLVNKKYQNKDGEYYRHYTTVLAFTKKEKVDKLSLNEALNQIRADITTEYNKDFFITLCYCPYILCCCVASLFETN